MDDITNQNINQVPSNASTTPSSGVPSGSSDIPPSMPPEFEEEHTSKIKIISLIIGLVVVVLIIALVIIFVFKPFQSNKKERVVLKVWGVWEDQSIYSSVFQEFMKKYPNVTIQYEQQDIKGLGKYVDRLRTRIENDTGPDIYSYHNSWVPQLKDYLLPFPSSAITATGLDTKYYQINDPLSSGGAKVYYGIPLGIDTLCLFVNNSLLKGASVQPPSTWDDLALTAKHLTVRDEKTGTIETSGVAMGGFSNVEHASDIISLLLVQNGADFKNLADPAKRKSAEQALQFYTLFALGDSKVWDNNMKNSKTAFIEGKVAMYFGYSWDVLTIKSANSSLDFSILPVPRIPGGRSDTIASFWQYGVSSGSKNPQEAFELLSFLGQRETLEKLFANQVKARGLGVAYPRSDMASLLSNNLELMPVVKQANNAWSTPFASDTYDEGMNQVLNQYMENAVLSIINSGGSVESAVDTLSQGVQNVLSKYGL